MGHLVEQEPFEHLPVALGEVALEGCVLTGQFGGEISERHHAGVRVDFDGHQVVVVWERGVVAVMQLVDHLLLSPIQRRDVLLPLLRCRGDTVEASVEPPGERHRVDRQFFRGHHVGFRPPGRVNAVVGTGGRPGIGLDGRRRVAVALPGLRRIGRRGDGREVVRQQQRQQVATAKHRQPLRTRGQRGLVTGDRCPRLVGGLAGAPPRGLQLAKRLP